MVKVNDSLIKIAERHNVKPSHLAAFNGLNANKLNLIRVGETLKIPTLEDMSQPDVAASIPKYEQGLVLANAQYQRQRVARLNMSHEGRTDQAPKNRLNADASVSPWPNLTAVAMELEPTMEATRQDEARKRAAQVKAARQSNANAPILTASKFSLFRDTRLGRKVSSLFQVLSGSKVDGMPYSHLGGYFPSQADIQDGKVWTAMLTGGPLAQVRMAAAKVTAPALEVLLEARSVGAATQPTRNAMAGYAKAAKKADELVRTSSALYMNTAAVSSVYGVGSSWLAGDTPTFQTALGSATTGLFLGMTGPAVANAVARSGRPGKTSFSTLVAYRSGIWGGYGLAATGDATTAATMALGGGLLTWAGPPVRAAVVAEAPALVKTANVVKADTPYLMPGVAATGWAKNRDNPLPVEPKDDAQ